VAPGGCFLGSTNLLTIAMGFGFSIFFLVYAAASFSGGLACWFQKKCQARGDSSKWRCHV
jgi:hypothetical protein